MNLISVNIDPTKSKTFTVLDKALGDFFENKLSAQERANVQSHIEAATHDVKINIDLDAATLSEVAAYLEWVDGAKAIDPTSFPRAAQRWQEALRNLSTGSMDMLQALQGVDPEAIEHFDQHKMIAASDAVALERLGLGSMMPIKHNQLRLSASEQQKAVRRTIAYFLLMVILPLASFTTLGEMLGLDEPLMTYGFLVVLVFSMGAAIWGAFHPTLFYARRFFVPTAKFWISDKGSYVLNQIFGGNPDKSVLWPVGPLDESVTEFIDDHIAKTPDVQRNLSSY